MGPGQKIVRGYVYYLFAPRGGHGGPCGVFGGAQAGRFLAALRQVGGGRGGVGAGLCKGPALSLCGGAVCQDVPLRLTMTTHDAGGSDGQHGDVP